ncbi:MAG: FtsW/RodA/SpoVE family cell cycle protein [Sulfurovum sp.]
MIDKPLLYAVMILLTLSLVMTYSLSTYPVLHFEYSSYHFFLRQLVAVTIGFAIIIVLSKLTLDKVFAKVGLILFFTFFTLILIMPFLPPSLVNTVGGAKRWIHIGNISIAPVEFFKVGFIFFLAWSFSRKLLEKPMIGFWEELRMFAPYLVLFLVAVIIIAIFQKDLGQVIVLGATLMVLFLFIGSSWRFFLVMLLSVILSFTILIIFAPHRIERIKSWWGMVQDSILSLFPFDSLQTLRIDETKEPYQIYNSLNAIYNGGFYGQGLGNGQFKLGYLSDVHTDFILAGITEELGLLGLSFVTFIMLFIVFRIFKIASKIKKPIYYLFSIGVGLLISFSFILNAYGISGITPIKGIAVPFLSYGGSHIVASCVAIGMVLMISKSVSKNHRGEMI